MSSSAEIVWVMGGTAVGKKAFIRHVASVPSLGKNPWKILWMEDVIEPPEIKPAPVNYLVRWQWGREETLRQWAETHSQQIILLTCQAETHLARAAGREPHKEWSEEQLRAEAVAVSDLANQLASDLKIPLTRIDVTSDNEWSLP